MYLKSLNVQTCSTNKLEATWILRFFKYLSPHGLTIRYILPSMCVKSFLIYPVRSSMIRLHFRHDAVNFAYSSVMINIFFSWVEIWCQTCNSIEKWFDFIPSGIHPCFMAGHHNNESLTLWYTCIHIYTHSYIYIEREALFSAMCWFTLKKYFSTLPFFYSHYPSFDVRRKCDEHEKTNDFRKDFEEHEKTRETLNKGAILRISCWH